MSWLKQRIRAVFESLENGLDAVTGPRFNPLCQLGALGWFLFWIVTASGIYLYIFFDTGVTDAYESIESLTHGQWWAGGVMRSFHRYASDALVIVAFTHLLREFGLDRMRGRHWFAWLTGLPLLIFIYVCGVTGYWMVWDRLAEYVALTTTEWLDALPIFAQPIARNFLDNASLSGRFFTLMVYLHIAAPLLMLLFMWVHIQRYNHARINPPRGLMVATLAGFTGLSLLHPALSQPPANLDQLAATVALDWFYLPLYPLIDRVGGATLWGIVALAFLLLALLPWLPRLRQPRPAVVHLDNCNGCGRCFADCPFGAITMQPRTDGAPFSQEAVVDPQLCMSCGICVGACPTATPFRRATSLVPGIEMPDARLEPLRDEIERQGRGDRRTGVMVFRCAHTGTVMGTGGEVAVIEVPCIAMIPPSFIDFIVHRQLASGVMFAGCREGDCYERLGNRWTEQRIAGERDPYLRERVPRERVALSWAGAGQPATHERSLSEFLGTLRALGPLTRESVRNRRTAWRWVAARLSRPPRYAAQASLLVAIGALVGWFSAAPAIHLLRPDEAVITLSFSHAAHRRQECRPLSAAELAQRQPNMRRPSDCPRGRWPVQVELLLNDRPLYRGEQKPAGLWSDGPSSVFKRFKVPSGAQHLTARLKDSGNRADFDYLATRAVELRPGQNLVVEFDAQQGFVFR